MSQQPKKSGDIGHPRSLEIPALDGIDGYVGVYFSVFLSVSAIIRDPNIPDFANRVNTMTHLLISLIPDDEKRITLRKKLNELYDTYCKEFNNADHSQKDACLVKASVETIGYVMQDVDKYIGLSHKNRLGFVSTETPVREKDEQ